jgi:hypothetical protein
MVSAAVVVFVLAMVAGATLAASEQIAAYAGIPAEETPPTEVPALVSVLEMLAGGIGTGAVLAFLFEKAAWFQKFSGETKSLVVLGVSIGLPLLATASLQFVPANVWTVIEPYWQALAGGFLAWAGSQVVFKAFIKKRTWEIEDGLDEVALVMAEDAA